MLNLLAECSIWLLHKILTVGRSTSNCNELPEKFFHLRFGSARMHLVEEKLQSELLTVAVYTQSFIQFFCMAW